MDVHTRALPGTPLINAKQRSPQLDLCRNTAGAMKMTSNWRSYDKLESANDWRFCASSLGIECCQNQIILKIFSHQNMSFHILSTIFRMQYLGDNLFLLSCCIVEDPENASADTFYSDSLHVWSRNHSTTRHYCPTNQDTFLKQGTSYLQSTPFFGKLFVSVMIAVRHIWILFISVHTFSILVNLAHLRYSRYKISCRSFHTHC